MGPDFYSLKPYVLLLYGAFGLTCLYAAALPSRGPVSPADRSIRRRTIGTYLAILAAALLLTVYIAMGSSLLLGGAAIAAVIFLLRPGSLRTPGTLFGGLSASVIVLSLVWWRIQPSAASPLPLAAFAILLGALSWGLSDPGRDRTRRVLLPILLFGAGGVALLADLGAFRVGKSAVGALVHHWGAFIGPSLHLKAGLVPFYDVPLQYGLGPTLAIAGACSGSDCWLGADIVFAAACFLEALLFLLMALATETRRGTVWICAVTTILFAAVFFWPGYPAEGGTLMGMPSSGGIRFLPTTLVACLWFFGRSKGAMVAMVPAILWSPESAAMSAAVFGLCGTAHFGLRKAVVTTASLLVGSYGALFLIHRSIYGIWIDPLALIEYVLHVPGALPINPFSDILLLAATLGLGGWLVCRPSQDPQTRRRDLAVTALLFAVAIYTLGRSHPNNVCNLAPFLVLVGLRALDRPTEDSDAVSRSVAIGLAVSAAALAFSPWNVLPFDPHVVTDVHAILPGFRLQEADIAHIRTQMSRTSGLGIADFGPEFARDPAETIVWTPMDPSSLWSFVPSERRQLYIERSARRLKRSGWAIFAEGQLFLLDDLQTAYTVRDQRLVDGAPAEHGFGSKRYTVACLDPKPRVAAKIVGPACPTEKDGVVNAALLP